jgi:ankyrin repeat protein
MYMYQPGRTPLYLACVEGRSANGRTDPAALLSCVTTLLTYGANPDRQDKEGGLSVLHYLSAGWQYPVVELLLNGFENPLSAGQRTNCADVNVFEESEGWTALHYVCSTTSLQRR